MEARGSRSSETPKSGGSTSHAASRITPVTSAGSWRRTRAATVVRARVTSVGHRQRFEVRAHGAHASEEGGIEPGARRTRPLHLHGKGLPYRAGARRHDDHA